MTSKTEVVKTFMCTVTVIQLEGGGFRLVTNRDENPDRPAASQPQWHEGIMGGTGSARAIWPTDGLAGGTWVAASEHGLALTLLNGNLGDRAVYPEPTRRQSRGILIPRLIGCESAFAAMQSLAEFELDRFDPFRLVAADTGAGPGEAMRVIDAFWDGRSLSTTDRGAGPACFASSGLGDWRVEPRLPLFEELVVVPGPTPAAQDEYHQHRWPDRLEISVLMERDEARTVSITRVEVRPSGGGAGEWGRFEISIESEPVGVGSMR